MTPGPIPHHERKWWQRGKQRASRDGGGPARGGPRGWQRVAVAVVVACAAGLLTALLLIRPSNDRDWIVEQAVLAVAQFAGDQVTIRNVRNFTHTAGAPIVAYEDRTYDLNALETVWYVVSPFSSDWRGPAHTFLSFGFADSRFLAISVEARKERGEEYTMWRGATRRFELMYVIGDERDLIRLRTSVWGDDVYLYPIRAPRAQVRQLFVQTLERANALAERPEFYHTLTNNCTTNIIDHVNRVATRPVPYGWRTLLPGYTDEVAAALGLLDTDQPIEQARQRFHINERARRFADDPLFSLRIRGNGTGTGAGV